MNKLEFSNIIDKINEKSLNREATAVEAKKILSRKEEKKFFKPSLRDRFSA